MSDDDRTDEIQTRIERRDMTRAGRRFGDPNWLARFSRPLAFVVVLQFVVLAALAVGIANAGRTAEHASATAKDALAVNVRQAREADLLRADVGRLTRQNEELLDEVIALRQQVEELGATPVEITIEDRRSTVAPAPTTTIAPRPVVTTSTTRPRGKPE